jgi:acyl carrier protein
MSNLSIVREYMVENFLFGDGNGLTDETQFLDAGIIDSTGMLELVEFLQERFGIDVADEEIAPENLNSLKCIEAYLGRKLASGVNT